MNQDQRKFLIGQVEDTCIEQVDRLKAQIPDKPSLNNYLVASFLDGSIEFNDIVELKRKMRERVLKMGKEDALVKTEDISRWSRRNREEEEEVEVVQVRAEDLFVIPEAYLVALREYEEKKSRIEAEIDQLKNTTKTIVLKLQIGSAQVLDKLVMQVDNMGDLSLVNTQLLIGDGSNK